MRAMLVIPSEEGIEVPAKAFSVLWNKDPAGSLVFDGSDEPLDHGDAAVLPDCAETWANSLPSAPALEGAAPEDTVLVAD